MGGYVGNAGVFLIKTLFDLFILAVMLRFLFQLVRADFYNPLSQVLFKITNPMLIPLRRDIPGIGVIYSASVVLMLALKYLELVVVILIKGGAFLPVAISMLSVTELLSQLVYIFIFSIIIQVIISWISPGSYNPVVSLIYSLNEPLMRPARRVIPPIGGLDLSPLVVLLALQLCLMLIIAPLNDLTMSIRL